MPQRPDKAGAAYEMQGFHKAARGREPAAETRECGEMWIACELSAGMPVGIAENPRSNGRRRSRHAENPAQVRQWAAGGQPVDENA